MVAPIPRARSDLALVATSEPVSGQQVSIFPGNGIQRPRDRATKIARRPTAVSTETRTRIVIPPIGRIFGGHQEISAHAGLRGGRTRTRTLDPLIKSFSSSVIFQTLK